VESLVHALVLWPEVGGRLGHGDYLGLVDLIRVPISHEGRGAFGEDVLQPIGSFPVGEGDQEAVVVLDCYDGGLVAATRSAPDVMHDRSAGTAATG
jgi:hypothetical protein